MLAAIILLFSANTIFLSVAGETCNRNKGRNGRLCPFLLNITVSKNSQAARGKIKAVLVSVIVCQMFSCTTSLTALKSAHFTRVKWHYFVSEC